MALQQKMMKYMTLFMGLIFYKVANGLCLYFIISSLWGIVERKLLPKPAAAGESSASSDRTTGGSAVTAGRLPSSDGSPPRNGSPKKGKGKKR